MEDKRNILAEILWGFIGLIAYEKIHAHFEHKRRMKEMKAYADFMRETRGSFDTN